MKRITIIGIMLSVIFILVDMANAGDYICLDPGHGGSDPGTSGPVYNLSEPWVNLQVALERSTLLDGMGQSNNIMRSRSERWVVGSLREVRQNTIPVKNT
jgi:N-acetylmuramoyl-L-alanine amidase